MDSQLERVATSTDAAALIERIPVPALLIRVNGYVVAANEPLLRCLAFDAEQVFGTTLADLLCERSELVGLLDTPCATDREIRFRSRDGTERRLQIAARRDADGTYLLCGADITARCASELAVNDERQRYLDMISAVSDSFWESNGASRSRLRIFVPHREGGVLSLKTQANTWPDDIADPSYDPDGFAAWQEMHERHQSYRDIIFRRRRNDGKEQYLRSSGVPWYTAGTFRGFRGVSIDVTAQVLAERALEQSRRHLEHAQRVAATGSSERDLQTGTEQWSAELYRILGLDPATYVRDDETVLALVHPEDRARIAADVVRARSGVPTPATEVRIIRPDGEVRTVYIERDIERNYANVPIRLLTLVKDVTELRAAERHQQETERQLQHSQKLEALGTLAGGTAHELNNILVPILALSKVMARRAAPGSRDRHHLDMILHGAERARDLVQQILTFSRKA